MTYYATIAGGGRAGRRTAQILDEYNVEVTIVEQDADRCDELTDVRVGQLIHGDAADLAVLKQANSTRAGVFAALTGKEGVNLSLCAKIEELVPRTQMITRLDHGTDEADLLYTAVSPTATGTKTVTESTLSRQLHSFKATASGIDLTALEVVSGTPVAGQQLIELLFPYRRHVITDADRELVAGPRTTLQLGKGYLLAAEPAIAEGVRQLMLGRNGRVY